MSPSASKTGASFSITTAEATDDPSAITHVTIVAVMAVVMPANPRKRPSIRARPLSTDTPGTSASTAM